MRLIICLLAALVTAAPAFADGHDGPDHDRARRAVEDGRARPLTDILARAATDFPGRLLEAELEDHHGRLVYELKMLSADGRVVALIYDAATAELVRIKGKGGPR